MGILGVAASSTWRSVDGQAAADSESLPNRHANRIAARTLDSAEEFEQAFA